MVKVDFSISDEEAHIWRQRLGSYTGKDVGLMGDIAKLALSKLVMEIAEAESRRVDAETVIDEHLRERPSIR